MRLCTVILIVIIFIPEFVIKEIASHPVKSIINPFFILFVGKVEKTGMSF